MHCRSVIVLVLGLVSSLSTASAAPPLVVETDPMTPDEQHAKFHLPPGFEIQVVVADPAIGQPMQLNFDAVGRLWVTHSVEYPHPARGDGVQPRDLRADFISDHEPRDRVTVIEGIEADGRPRRITHFTSGLNIPIGQVSVYPSPSDTNGRSALPLDAIVYSIPTIDRLRDTTGDGIADEREALYGPFGNVDTHGMCSSFTRWIDGWIYATHGFRNTSNVRLLSGTASGTDDAGSTSEPDSPRSSGTVLTLNSGNTFRFREDGSRIEQHTWGQVNPFGMTFDPWGNLYTADCHSMPVTCLLRGAYYSSFGKPHDGLGFGPDMIDHNHGSTGICGVAWYAADQFPAEYRDCLYICNPVTGQVHRDRLKWTGSSPMVETQPEFITCDDGWFRPVDVKLGPDGALYVADFYNCIIGHYEVPLDNPRRDRVKGRVWRVVYRGEESGVRSQESGEGDEDDRLAAAQRAARTSVGAIALLPDLTALNLNDLVARLGDPNLTVRTLATNLVCDRFGREAVQPLLQIVSGSAGDASDPDAPGVRVVSAEQRAHALWVLHRMNALSPDVLQRLAVNDSNLVRTHLARALAERPDWAAAETDAARMLLQDDDAMVRRAAAEALGRHPATQHVPLLLAAGDRAVEGDTHLRHTVRIAIRNHLLDDAIAGSTEVRALFADHDDALAAAALGAPTPGAAALLLARLQQEGAAARERTYLQHIARYASADRLGDLVHAARATGDARPADQHRDLLAIVTGLEQRGDKAARVVGDWARELVSQLLAEAEKDGAGWTSLPLPGRPPEKSPFDTQRRPSADGQRGVLFFSTLPAGEQRTGVFRSDSFALPERLSFFMAGHNGMPPAPAEPNNVVRLRDAESGAVLQEALPPRDDTAQRIEWDLTPFRGRHAYVEIVDGDTRGAFAWLAVGRFSLDALNPRTFSALDAAIQLVTRLRMTDVAPTLNSFVASPTVSPGMKLRCAEALLGLDPDARLSALLPLAADLASPAELRGRILGCVRSRDAAELQKTLADAMRAASAVQQRQMADALAGSRAGSEALFVLVDSGLAAPRMLTDAALAQKLKAAVGAEAETRIAALTQGLPPVSEELNQLLAERRRSFTTEGTSPGRGRAAFKQHCAACHQLGGEGKKIGPQLDGVGIRGADRLLEDLLDPNRNVDAAFRTSTVLTKDGQVLTGLVQREEGALLVLADNKGEEFRVLKDDIEEQQKSTLSLMPVNLVSALPEAELHELLAYLLQQTAKPGQP